MNYRFAERMKDVPRSFIREILKVAGDPKVISFAGGLPNPDLFPVEGIAKASRDLLAQEGSDVLQYSTTEGHLPLRRKIAARYRDKYNLEVDPDTILITTGSQQALDLIGKVFINPGDKVLVETPSYLGAIQAFSVYQPRFVTIPLQSDGPDLEAMAKVLDSDSPALYYSIPNFQNPSGITASLEKRQQMGALLGRHNTIFVEDDPYGELRFLGQPVPPVRSFCPDSLLLGSFSKVMVPAFRLGWICAPRPVFEKLVIAKQAADLHSNYFAQRIIDRFMEENDLDAHIKTLQAGYGRQRNLMVDLIRKHFPAGVSFTEPEGGMFLWVTLPAGLTSLELFELTIKENVAFVPGNPFYTDGGGSSSLRLNFSNCDADRMERGIKVIAEAIRQLQGSQKKGYLMI